MTLQSKTHNYCKSKHSLQTLTDSKKALMAEEDSSIRIGGGGGNGRSMV